MEKNLQLCIFVILIQVSFAVWQRVTVKKGQTLNLSCPISNAHLTNVDWKNPEGYIMFFKHDTVIAGVKDNRYSLTKLSESEFTISISDVTFKDGGNYTCTQYDHHTTEKIVEVTVLDRPKMEKEKHEGRFDIKCTAEGNHYPPKIFWKLGHGPEILAYSQVLHEGNKYVTEAILHVQSVGTRVAVKCLVRHPALHSQPLMNFVKIGQDFTKSRHTTTTKSPTSWPQGSTEVQRETTSWLRHGRTTAYQRPSNEPKTVTAPTEFTLNSDTATDSHLSNSGWTAVSETTETTSNNRTEGNRTGSFGDSKMQTGGEGSSVLLVFLVTCLIVCLLVVVIFFAIKLRRAHITWKKENEDSDPSEESCKSKSSQEERNSQGQRRRGIFNTAFAQYVVEEPPVTTSVINTEAMAATESVNKEQTSQPQSLGPTLAQSRIKETEL